MSDKQVVELLVKMAKMETSISNLVDEFRQFKETEKEKLELKLDLVNQKFDAQDKRITFNRTMIWGLVMSIVGLSFTVFLK